MGHAKPLLHICEDCRFTMKSCTQKCPRCGSIKIVCCGLTARPPRKSASKKKWNVFWDIVFGRNGKFSHPYNCR